MVLMEMIINLEDSIESAGMSSPLSLITSSTPNGIRKRKKRYPKPVRKIRKLLKSKKKIHELVEISDQSINLDATSDPKTNSPQSIDPDATLDPKTIGPNLKNCNTGEKSICANVKRIRKRKKSSVVVIESDDECVIINQSKSKKSLGEDILYLSDSSVIELSDSEDVGVAAGMVETTSCDVGSSSRFNPRQIPCSSSTSRTSNTNQCNKQNGPRVLQELRKIFRIEDPKTLQNKQGGANAQTSNVNEVSKITKQDSRHSISYLPPESTLQHREGPRPIVIDGSNVAFGHGKERFSAKGIEICVDYFLRRKHKEVRAFIPQFRRRHVATVGIHILEKLEKEGHLVYTPSRQVDGKRITSYDDRFIVEYAAKTGGIIVTRDNYQDLLAENKAWSDTINFRLLQYTFVGDMIMFPQDPLGRGGPTLDKFLMF